VARRPTIADVALAAVVSVATVSTVINGRDGIATDTSARVLEVVQKLGYESSLVARSLRSHRTHVIGILVAEFEPFSAEILKGAGSALGDTDYELLAYTGVRQSGGADRHLIELAHGRIGFMAGRPDLESSRLREAGYRRALAEAGIEVDPSLVRMSDYRRDSAHEPAVELLARPGRPTAVFAGKDLSAIGTMETTQELGLDVPGDISVIGFDDIPGAATHHAPLSTVCQPIQQMGAAAVEPLIALIDGSVPETRHVRLPTSLVLRGTTAPLG
jgi:LacI family transcriptional regulator